MFKNSVLLSAHPDDEILWFSSIIEKVDKITICFLDYKTAPEMSAGRKKTLNNYPLGNISCLEIEESDTFQGANWHNPVMTKYGIEISNSRRPKDKYIENYYILKKNLKNKLLNCRNIFTHNPWGEYGNEDHVQVYRVTKELQQEMGFELWFPNYFSNISFNLMLRYISGRHFEYVTLETNRKIASTIKNLYRRNGCWTWYDDWQWLKQESFIKDSTFKKETKAFGNIFPLNLIVSDLSNEMETKRPNFFGLILQKIKMSLRKNNLPRLT